MTVATVLATAALAGYCLLLVVPSVLGFQRDVLTGGSMEPTLHRGSLVFDQVTPVEELVVGDVITYVPPGMSSPLSHRIMSITPGDDGELVFTTRATRTTRSIPGCSSSTTRARPGSPSTSRGPGTRCGCSAAGCPGSC